MMFRTILMTVTEILTGLARWKWRTRLCPLCRAGRSTEWWWMKKEEGQGGREGLGRWTWRSRPPTSLLSPDWRTTLAR
jgi:hypothetical protein